MSFLRFTNKLNLIQSVFNKPQRLSVERQIGRAFDERRTKFSISRPHSEALQLDILYALARHARWVKVPLFKDVLVDFLVSEHEIPRALSESMVNEVLESCEALLGDDPNFTASELLQGKVDEEFLTYIFVAAASSTHESAVREQLGLGAGLLRSLKSAANSLAARDHDHGGTAGAPKLFLPDVDTVFARIMIKLTEAVRGFSMFTDLNTHYSNSLTANVLQFLLPMFQQSMHFFALPGAQTTRRWTRKPWSSFGLDATRIRRSRAKALFCSLRLQA